MHQQPDATPDELRMWLVALGGPAISPATTDRAVQATWTGDEKKSVYATERDSERVGPCGRRSSRRCKPRISPVSNS